MIGFLCSTPYHILLAINMSLSDFKNEKKVLVIFRRFKDSDRICKLLCQFSIFEEVLLLETHNFDGLTHWNRRYRMFSFYRKFNKMYPKYSFKEFIFFSLDFLDVSFIAKKISKINPSCKFAFAEDGIGSYLSNDIYTPSDRAKFWLDKLNRKKFLDKIDTLYLKNPNLLTVKSDFKIKKMDDLAVNDVLFNDVITTIWPGAPLTQYDILFLQQPFSEDGRKLIGMQQDKALEVIWKSFSEKLTIKLHPRTIEYNKLDRVKYLKSEGLFELEIHQNYKVKVLIGVNSTALLTPYLLWKETTPIIFLHKLCGVDSFNVNMDKFIERFKVEFEKSGGQLFAPESFESLIDILTSLLNVRK